MRGRCAPRAMPKQRGVSIVELTLVLPLALLLILACIQMALVFYAKSNLNYALHEAARAGISDHARLQSILAGFRRGLVPYYGGGNNTAELTARLVRVRLDLAFGGARLEVLSPTSYSFDDYASPHAAALLGVAARVIPNAGIVNLRCPRDRPSCAADPRTNRSGQTLQDANLLALRVTYGIPRQKQVPLVSQLYTSWLRVFGGREDAFVRQLVLEGRIPIVARTTMRMLSEPIEY
jgi:TadE-like protein